ncbi:hypothetical protein [Hymenobacter sp. B81]|uniref:hypothetical protein n=1 Tax=Hymenobacter sp. B81 TaxID=3344878 RepID=UPI0037DD7C4B
MTSRLLFCLLLGAAFRVQAQQPATSAPAARSVPDVILRIDGSELPAKVLLVGPQQVRYLALTDSVLQTGDTLSLARQEIFLIRFANGTRELMRPAAEPAAAAASPLAGLSESERIARGRNDARAYYVPPKGVFWGTYGATFLGAYAGIGAGAAIAATPPKRATLVAPQPGLLDDAAYLQGYRRQAQNRKLGKAAAGFGAAVGTQIALLVLLFASITR